MIILLSLFQTEHPMGAEFSTVTTVNTDHRFIDLIIPENTPHKTGITAVTASCTLGDVNTNATTISGLKGTCRAHFCTGRVLAGSTNHHNKPSFHASDRPDAYTGSGQSSHTLPPRTCKHTALTADASFRVHHRQPHSLYLQCYLQFQRYLNFPSTPSCKS